MIEVSASQSLRKSGQFCHLWGIASLEDEMIVVAIPS